MATTDSILESHLPVPGHVPVATDEVRLSVPGSSAREKYIHLVETTGRRSTNDSEIVQGPATDSDCRLVVLGSTTQVRRSTL